MTALVVGLSVGTAAFFIVLAEYLIERRRHARSRDKIDSLRRKLATATLMLEACRAQLARHRERVSTPERETRGDAE